MHLTVRTLTGNKLQIENVKEDDTVGVLKALVWFKEGLPPETQRLIFASKQIEDGHNLFEYGIRDGSEIHLVLNMKGC